jgi:hypothetical protein
LLPLLRRAFYLECGAFPPLLFLFLFLSFIWSAALFPPLLFLFFWSTPYSGSQVAGLNGAFWMAWLKNKKRRKRAALQMKDKKQKERNKSGGKAPHSK